jgi:hypothetical protein
MVLFPKLVVLIELILYEYAYCSIWLAWEVEYDLRTEFENFWGYQNKCDQDDIEYYYD